MVVQRSGDVSQTAVGMGKSAPVHGPRDAAIPIVPARPALAFAGSLC